MTQTRLVRALRAALRHAAATMAIPVAIAAAGVRCFSDLVVDPKTPRFEFTVLPADTTPWAVAGDTVTPFRVELLVDGSPASVDLDLLADSNASIVEVLSRARVLGKSRGVARLVARPVSSGLQLDSLRDTVRVRVVAASAAVLPVSVTLRSLGETALLAGRALDARRDTIESNAGQFTWTSTNPAIATVDAAGRLKAIANGSVRIRAVIDADSASMDVTVSQAVDTVAVDSARLTLTALGATGTLAAVAKDARGNALSTQPPISWRSTSSRVTVAPAAGATTTVTAVGYGADTVWAKSGSDSSRVPVTTIGPAATIVVSPAGKSISGVGATQTLTAQARDANGNLISDRTFTWASLNPNVATIDSTTGVATAVSSGQVTVSATMDVVTGYGLLSVAIPGATAVSSWTEIAVGTNLFLSSAWGTSSSDIYAVGDPGTILHYNGTSWTAMTSGTTQGLRGVWGTSSSDIYAVGLGPGGTILRYNGANWSAMTSPTTDALLGVWGASSSDIYAVGQVTTIHRYNGTSWSLMTTGGSSRLLEAVWGTSSSDVYTVGQTGTILRYNGMSWSPMTSGTSEWLHGVWGTSSSDIYAVGSAGTILHCNGTSWTAMTSPTTQALWDVWGTSSSDVYAVGDGGTILRYNGTSWSPMTSGTTGNLVGVWGTSTGPVWAVVSGSTLVRGDR